MLAQGELSLLSKYEAKITSRVAKLLSLEEILVNLKNYPSLTISSKAGVYLANQIKLKEELPDILNDIKILKAGSWTLSNVSGLGFFYARMENQIKDVGELQDEAKNTGAIPSPIEGLKYMPIIAGVGFILLLYAAYRGSRR